MFIVRAERVCPLLERPHRVSSPTYAQGVSCAQGVLPGAGLRAPVLVPAGWGARCGVLPASGGECAPSSPVPGRTDRRDELLAAPCSRVRNACGTGT